MNRTLHPAMTQTPATTMTEDPKSGKKQPFSADSHGTRINTGSLADPEEMPIIEFVTLLPDSSSFPTVSGAPVWETNNSDNSGQPAFLPLLRAISAADGAPFFTAITVGQLSRPATVN
jgi:hypothetical protein